MSVQLAGNGGVICEIDGTVWRAQRTTQRPPELGAGGGFRVAVSNTTAAAPAAGAPLVSFRWTSGTLNCLITSCEIRIQVSTASTAGLPEMSGFIARGFSASDTGGTALVMTGNNQKVRTSHGTSVVGDFRAASVGVLTAGTRTLDPQPFITAATPLALGSSDRATYDIDGGAKHPIFLAANEGLVFTNVTALTAGVYRYTVTLGWLELPSF